MPSPAAGVLTEILVPEGETVEVGVKLAVIGDGSGASGSSDAPAAAAAEAPRAGRGGRAAAAATAAPPVRTATASGSAAVPSRRRRLRPRRAEPLRRRRPTATEPGAQVALADGAPAPLGERHRRVGGHRHRRRRAHHPGRRAAGGRRPAVGRRRRAATAAPPPAARAGSPPSAAPAAPPARVAPPAPPVSMAPFRTAGDQVVPFSNMRRRTAEHMVRSKATSPHAFIANEVDFEAVERVRTAWGERFKAEEGFSLTYLPFVARAAVEALRDFPLLNASVVDDSLVVHAEVNLGIAVDLSHEGLIVPVIHRAEEVTLRGVARRIRDLAERARGRQLNADDIAGGTFSITNDGPFGTYFTVPIINQPQVAILATDGIARRPVVVTQPDGSESIAIHSTGILGVSWDHRAVDGAYVSLFLARVAELLGTRDWAAEL